MNKQFAIVAVLVLVALGIGGWVLLKDDSNPDTVSSTTTQTDSEQPIADNDSAAGTQLAQFTAANVAEHASKDDCWTIISGKIYDLTSYIPRHQGGDEILRACGTDGTSLFTQRQTTDGDDVGTGTPHSSEAMSQLERLYVGDLSTSTPDDSEASDQAAN